MGAGYTVYIDESGDLGFCRGTRWFVLTGVIVKKSDEKSIRNILKSIRTKFNYNELHMKKIVDFKRRAYIARQLSEAEFKYINILADTHVYDSMKVKGTDIAYNYLCKLLLERVSLAMESVDGCADIVLSARGTSRDGELIEYIKEKLLPYKGNDIDPKRIGTINAYQSSEWDLLQLADVCATSTFLAYEESEYGFCMPCLALSLASHLFTINGKVADRGMKFVKPTVQPKKSDLQAMRPCSKK